LAFIVLGVGGGIAAYKSATLCSSLIKDGHEVQVLMTQNATKFIQPVTFQALSKRPVICSTFDEPDATEIAHIGVADRADLYLIAPATANLIAKLACGLADDMVTTTALATTAPLFIAPAMNVHMYTHPTVVSNLQTLQSRGATVIQPGVGLLACGYTGKGRLAEPEDIMDIVRAHFVKVSDFANLRVLVTAGPTVEDIDPVRYLSNSSSGKMGYAIATAAVQRGADVTLISGPTHLQSVPGCTMKYVRSTADLLEAVALAVVATDMLISAAAPADFRPTTRLNKKWKKSEGIPNLELTPTPDVLAHVAEHKKSDQTFVGFAAETEHVLENGKRKLASKQLDLVVINDVSQIDAGFGVDTNRVILHDKTGRTEAFPLLSKFQVADEILTVALAVRRGQSWGPTAQRE